MSQQRIILFFIAASILLHVILAMMIAVAVALGIFLPPPTKKAKFQQTRLQIVKSEPKPPEPEPEPEKEAIPPPSRPPQQQFVPTDERNAVEEQVESDLISAHNTRLRSESNQARETESLLADQQGEIDRGMDRESRPTIRGQAAMSGQPAKPTRERSKPEEQAKEAEREKAEAEAESKSDSKSESESEEKAEKPNEEEDQELPVAEKPSPEDAVKQETDPAKPQKNADKAPPEFSEKPLDDPDKPTDTSVDAKPQTGDASEKAPLEGTEEEQKAINSEEGHEVLPQQRREVRRAPATPARKTRLPDAASATRQRQTQPRPVSPPMSMGVRKSDISGSLGEDGPSSDRVGRSALGRYKQDMYRKVGSFWRLAVGEQMSFLSVGRVKVRFFVRPNGVVDQFEVIDESSQTGAGRLFTEICINAIRDCAPFGPFSDRMKEELPEDMKDGYWEEFSFSIYGG